LTQQETIAEVGEFGLIERLEKVLESEGLKAEGTALGIGDDAAVLRVREGWEVLVTCDALVQGRHYLLEFTTPTDLGRRAMAVNLSDIGAMGGVPRHAVVSLGLRRNTPVEHVEAMYRGFAMELRPYGAAIVGGNLTMVEGGAFIDVTLLGEVEAGRAIRRSTARAGDAVLVTGCPGQAAAGLRLLKEAGDARALQEHPLVQVLTRPQARAREGRKAALTGRLSAMIDTSDGFLGDLGHVCAESKVGARLFAERVPVSQALRQVAEKWGEDPLELFLRPSDDYELILTCKPEHVQEVREVITGVSQVGVAEVGVLTDRGGEIVLVQEGEERRLSGKGWDHFAVEG
jgi:thiamine-monophosphate kinase